MKLSLQVVEDLVFPAAQSIVQNKAEHSAGEDFTDADGEHHQWDREIYQIGVLQNKRNNNCVGKDRRKWSKERVCIPQLPCKESTDQSCKASKNNIGD